MADPLSVLDFLIDLLLARGLEGGSMKLYMNSTSPNVRRVRLTAAVLGLQLEEKNVDSAKGEQKKPEFLALNPNGAVPTLTTPYGSGS